jgi:hypothetical protein
MTERPVRAKHGLPAPVGLSVRIYSWLLAAYPGRFRAEYGYHMQQVFRDACRHTYRQEGVTGMAALWLRTTLDLVRTTVEEHVERGIEMDREKFVKWSGWVLMAGAILFAAGLILGNFDSDWNDPIGGVDAFYEISQIAGMSLGQIFFLIGLLGLRSGYADRSGRLGAILLIAAITGGVVSLAGMSVMNTSEAGWAAWVAGLLTMTLALAGFGLVTMRRKVFSSWNFAPLLAGVFLPVLFVVGFAIESSGGSLGDWIFVLGTSGTSIGLLLLGYRMQADIDAAPTALA